MMHKVLLVDDEPIILSGIKFLIDWETQGCQIVGTARNGKQALEEMDRLCPDIVICDISMPVMSGLEMLRIASETHPEAAFIMLTNYQDFDLARDALRYQAVDYLLKTQLEAQTLEESLNHAKEECDRRRKISKVRFVEDYISTNKSSLIGENVLKIVTGQKNGDFAENYRVLRENGTLTTYAMLDFILDFSRLPNLGSFTSADKKRVFEFQKDMIEKLVGNFFPHFSMILPPHSERKLLVFAWDLPQESYSSSLSKLYEKLDNASDNVTQARLSLLATDPFTGEGELCACYAQLLEMTDYYYNTGCPFLTGRRMPQTEYAALSLSGQLNRLTAELRSKNIAQTKAIFDRIRQEFSTACHRRENAITLCVELFSVVASVMASLLPEDNANYHYFGNKNATLQTIQGFLTKDEVLAWMDELRDSALTQLEELYSSKPDILEKACEYIRQNADKRILLQDVADHISISPSYLSALFKKQFNQNFVDYVNKEKTDRACELIREGKYRIYEISYMLGFENAYYFTKVFKRHTGMTPTEYQYKCKGLPEQKKSDGE